jgi:branched-chain amino acid aminotransferase
MPEVPTEMFVEGVAECVRRNAEFVPPYGNQASMYIRPLLFASGHMLGLAPLAEEYSFLVTVLPAGGYFGKGGGDEGVDALVMEDHDRAAPHGLGHVKAAGNYAADLEPVHNAKKKGYGTTLYLDAREKRYIEEFSVCNFVGITADGRFVTPKARSILASTTNRMLQVLAKEAGLIVEQREIDFDKEIESFKEVGMVGTAAVVVRVKSITRGDKVYRTTAFDTLASLREKFISVQNGDLPDNHGWMYDVCDVKLQE